MNLRSQSTTILRSDTLRLMTTSSNREAAAGDSIVPNAQVPDPLSPAAIARLLATKVVGQRSAVRDLAIALAKRLVSQPSGNLLLIGSSGSGKTTLMRAAEWFLSEHTPRPVPLLRIHANVLGRAGEEGRPGEQVLHGLLEAARQQQPKAHASEWVERACNGIVFVDEVDKIRSVIGGNVHLAGVRAQEALLTLAENESIPLVLPAWLGAEETRVDSRGLLFVAAGAFEGLYDAVYDRITVGADRGSLKPVTRVVDGEVAEEHPFVLADWLQSEDLFEYGMSPQFLSRFESVTLMDDLTEEELVRILLENEDSPYHRAVHFFEQLGYQLVVSPAALGELASRAAERKRMGARALQELCRRLLREIEFAPEEHAVDGAILLDVDDVERILG